MRVAEVGDAVAQLGDEFVAESVAIHEHGPTRRSFGVEFSHEPNLPAESAANGGHSPRSDENNISKK